jgi:glucose/arabinose dehydrogenase
MKSNVFLISFSFFVLNNACVRSQDTWQVGNTTLTERDLATGTVIPWEILWGPDDHIWVSERRGKILRIEPESGNIQTVLDHTGPVTDGNGEPGMLGMAMHPDFVNYPLVYVVYNFGSGWNIKERLSTFEWNGTALINENILIDDIPGGGIHNGSRILFLPDGTLLMTTGDIGDGGVSSQSLNSLNGKTLRINADGSIPEDNPYPNSYVYTWGHRNAQGLCLGPNGLVFSTEHGQSSNDEINIIEPTRNYGWPEVEGFCDQPGESAPCDELQVKEPIRVWTPCVAVNGIEFYNHPAIPEWQNSILMAVLGGLGAQYERLSVLHLNETGTEILSEDQYFNSFNQRIRDVCVNPHNGAVYIALNGSSYPGSGPNIIKEFRNIEYEANNLSEAKPIQRAELWPNPAEEKLNIRLSESFIGKTIEIVSFQGNIVWSSVPLSAEFSVDINSFASGMYYLRATSELGVITHTFLRR